MPLYPSTEKQNINMKCPKCGHENPASSRFCEKCSAKLKTPVSIWKWMIVFIFLLLLASNGFMFWWIWNHSSALSSQPSATDTIAQSAERSRKTLSLPVSSQKPNPSQPVLKQKQEKEVMTQEAPEVLAQEQKRLEAEKERIAREAAEKERIAREAAELQARIEADRRAEQAQKLGSLFGESGNNTGSGNTQGATQKGNPVGLGNDGGNNWALEGRSLKGTLPRPSKEFKQEGKVVVQIRVNAAGDVISATQGKGTTINDKKTIQLAIDAAIKAKFSAGDHDQIGTITYTFKFN